MMTGKTRLTLRLIPCLVSFCLLTTVSIAQAATWLEGKISGNFTGLAFSNDDTPYNEFRKSRYVKGEGESSFSFGLGKSLQGGGDIFLEIFFKEDSVNFKLYGTPLLDLGALSSPPKSVSIPKSEEKKDPLSEFSPTQIGHYYLVLGKNWCTVFQTLDLVISDSKRGGSRLFSLIKRSAHIELIFRYLRPVSSIEKLNAILADQQKPASKPASAEKPLSAGKSDASAVISPSSADPELLTGAYEQFQADAKMFLDLPIEQATIKKCDAMLQRAKELNTQINDHIMDLDSTITGNKAKITSLNDRLSKITDLQLRDRAETRINSIKQETIRLEEALKIWTARLVELQKTDKKLKEYRLIIGI